MFQVLVPYVLVLGAMVAFVLFLIGAVLSTSPMHRTKTIGRRLLITMVVIGAVVGILTTIWVKKTPQAAQTSRLVFYFNKLIAF
jgi:hypothetical protein